MFNLLINCPLGEQKIIEVGEGGGYYDLKRVEWDERKDGALPDGITLGKMKRNGKTLDTLPDYLPDHLAFLAAQQTRFDQQAKKTQLDTDTQSDGDLSVLRSMSGSQIDEWFTANIKTVNDASKLLKKVVKSLVKQNLL